MFHKIKSVTPVDDLRLIVSFSEGITKEYNINPLIKKWPAFKQLKTDSNLFYAAEVDTGGYGVIWNDDLDLSCDEIYENGQTIETPFDGILAFTEATQLWNLNESTLRKAISYGKFKNGIDVCKFGKQWVISKEALIREYGYPPESL